MYFFSSEKMNEGEVLTLVSTLSMNRLTPVQVDRHTTAVVQTAGSAPPSDTNVSSVQKLASRAEQPSQFLR